MTFDGTQTYRFDGTKPDRSADLYTCYTAGCKLFEFTYSFFEHEVK
jgi:hypothetical protein